MAVLDGLDVGDDLGVVGQDDVGLLAGEAEIGAQDVDDGRQRRLQDGQLGVQVSRCVVRCRGETLLKVRSSYPQGSECHSAQDSGQFMVRSSEDAPI